MAERQYLNYLGIIGNELEFIIENNDVFYYTCEINRATEYIEIFAEPSDKKYTLTGDIGVVDVHKGANTFTIKLMENDVLLKTYDISVVVRKWRRRRSKRSVEKPSELIVQKVIEAENIQEEITDEEAEETMLEYFQEQPQAPVEPEIETKQEHIPPPRLLRLDVINGILDPEFQADIFEYNIKRKKNKDRIVIEAEGEMAGYIIGGDIGGHKLSQDEQTFFITCTSQDHSMEMVYYLHVEGEAKKMKEKKFSNWKRRNKKTEKPPKKKTEKPPKKNKTKRVKERKSFESRNGRVLFSLFLCILTVVAFITFEMPMRQIHTSRKRKSFELSQRRKEITNYLEMEDSFRGELEEYIQEVESFVERYPQMQDEKELLELLDIWKRETVLERLDVTTGRPQPVTQTEARQNVADKKAGGLVEDVENIIPSAPPAQGQTEEDAEPLLMSRTVAVKAKGEYEDLLRLYEMVYESHRNILVDNIELRKNKKSATLLPNGNQEVTIPLPNGNQEATIPLPDGNQEEAPIPDQSQNNPAADTWILSFDMILYYYMRR